MSRRGRPRLTEEGPHPRRDTASLAHQTDAGEQRARRRAIIRSREAPQNHPGHTTFVLPGMATCGVGSGPHSYRGGDKSSFEWNACSHVTRWPV
jgi:hypothetical protein